MVGKLAWGVGRQRLSAGVYSNVTHNPRGLGFSFGASAPFFLFKYIQLLFKIKINYTFLPSYLRFVIKIQSFIFKIYVF